MSNQKHYKFVFTAFVKTVTLALKFPCVVSVNWRRSQKVSQIKQRKQIENGVINFNSSIELECNMTFDTKTKKFQQKKTKFTVLIYSDKGNKQAGEVNYDVAEFLNAKQKELEMQKQLQKCPDKNAKLTLVLSAYMKEQVQPDVVSGNGKENNSVGQGSMLNESAIQQAPDFKKKRVEIAITDRSDQRNTQNAPMKSDRILSVSKAAKQRLKLQEQNKKLKEQLQQLRQLQFQNTTLKKRLEQAQKKAVGYYSKKFQQMKRDYNEAKAKAKAAQQLMIKKQELEKQMKDCKEQMGRIINFAITSGNNQMAEAIYNIYQSQQN